MRGPVPGVIEFHGVLSSMGFSVYPANRYSSLTFAKVRLRLALGRSDRSCPASSPQPGMPPTPAASPDAAGAAAAKTVLIGLSKNLEGQRRADFASTMQWDSNRPSIAVRLAFVAASLSAPHETERQRHALRLFRSASNDG